MMCYWGLSKHWLAGFVMLSVPVLIIVHGCLVVFWLIFKRERVWLSGIGLVLGLLFWPRIYSIHTPKDSKPDLTIMSYNAKVFDVLNFLDGKDPDTAPAAIKWAIKDNADIKCFQEFYNYDKRPMFAVLKQLKETGYKYRTLLHPLTSHNEQNFNGLAIVSKFPIIGRGEQIFGTLNGMVYADIEINKTNTIRVINIHLQSISVKFGAFRKAYRDNNKTGIAAESKYIIERLKLGFSQHPAQFAVVMKVINDSPYPVILCGDFNETPFGYSYSNLKRKLNNAFEDAGHGFGFSYKNDPKFIRIDHQFYDPKTFEVIDFKTRNDISTSDHYPIFGYYRFK
jgi:endonuclease/exonuclease/phosphatase family metal-dependent hydrolase